MAKWKFLEKADKFLRPTLYETKKQLKIAMDGLLRPFGGSSRHGSGYSGTVFAYPIFPFHHHMLYDIAYNSDALSAVHNALRREIFRNGFEFLEAKNTDEVGSEEETQTTNEVDRKEALEFLENINENGQSIIDVLMEIEDDLSIRDDGFMLFINQYSFDFAGDILSEETKLTQVLRADPRYMGKIMNKYDRPGYDDQNIPLFVCPIHRSDLLEGKDRCDKHDEGRGLQALKAYFFTDYGDKRIFYGKKEIVHRSKYRPSKRFGYSPVLTVWQKVRTLFSMDTYMMQLYASQRPPKAGLFFKTDNQAGLKKTWDEAKQNARLHPHLPVIMSIPNTTNGKSFVEFIDFMKPLAEMQYTEARNEMRQVIGSVYGVMPIFQGDMSQGGGLNNEGLELTVTNRAVEYGQGIHNKYYLARLVEAMGAKGMQILLKPNEEQDEMAKLQRENQSLINGQLAMSLGLEAEFDDDSKEVIIKGGELSSSSGLEGFEDGLGGSSDFFTDSTIPGSGEPPQPNLNLQKAEMESVLKQARKRPPFTKLASTLRKKIDDALKALGRKPTEDDLQKVIREVNLNLQKQMHDSTNSLFKKSYEKEADKVFKELKVEGAFGVRDENALVALQNQSVLSDAFSNISSDLVVKVQDVITDAFRDPAGLSVGAITERIKNISDVADFQAERIARTEIGKVSSAARKVSYQKQEGFDTFKFRWIGPNDFRTTDTSKRIKSRTKSGVSYAELVKIVEEESAKDFPDWTVNKDAPQSHWNSRHIFLKLSS